MYFIELVYDIVIRPVLNSPVDHEGERGENITLVNISLYTVLDPEFFAHRCSPYRHQLKLKEYLSCTHESTMHVENKLYKLMSCHR